jgi:Protein of unknown function (DUF2591)
MSNIRHKVSELEGALLDAAVAKAHGWKFEISGRGYCLATVPDLEHGDGNGLVGFAPSTSWEDGGPIIERERITHYHCGLEHWGEPWFAGKKLVPQSEGSTEDSGFHVSLWMDHQQTGPSLLIAAMRAYVASKFGDVVDLP